jgi:hypothetical protein
VIRSIALLLLAGSASADTTFGGTHWRVDSEIGLPLSMRLAVDGSEFRATALQITAKLDCDVRSQKKKTAEVGCTIADIGLRGASPGGAKLADVESTLASIDDALTGATIVFTTSAGRPVQRPSLEGVDAKDASSTLLYVAERLLVGFDLAEPSDAPEWRERGSTLMQLPTGVKAGGTAKVEHRVKGDAADVEVVAVGAGRFDIQAHAFFTDPLSTEAKRQGLSEKAEAGDGSAGPEALTAVAREVDIDVSLGSTGGLKDDYALPTDDVPPHAIFDTKLMAKSRYTSGELQERVWALRATPTTTSVTSASGWTTGHIERIDADTTIEVGETHPTSPPGRAARAQLRRWRALAP